MNLIKVLLRTLASAQPCAVSQGDYSYLGFEPLPNHVKNDRDMWNSAFSRCSQERQLARLTPLFGFPIHGSDERQGRGEARNVTPMLSLKTFTCQPARAAAGFQACCPRVSLHRNIDTAANWWKMTPNRATAINQSMPDFWAAELQHAVLPSRHVWAKTVFTQDNLNWARGRLKEGKSGPAYQRPTQERQLIVFVHSSVFFCREISTYGMC